MMRIELVATFSVLDTSSPPSDSDYDTSNPGAAQMVPEGYALHKMSGRGVVKSVRLAACPPA